MTGRSLAAPAIGALAAAPLAIIVLVTGGDEAWWGVVAVAVAAAIECAAAPRGDSAGSRLDNALAAATALTLLAVWGLAIAGWREVPAWLAVLGSVTFVAGVALRVVAMRALGDSFCSHVRAAPRAAFVTDGIYARARHPSELGVLLLGLGAVLVTASPWAALAASLLVGLVIARTAREDSQLEELVGEAHRDYRAVVSRFGLSFWLTRPERVRWANPLRR